MLKKFLIENWLLLLILLIAAFCRLYRISDYMEFLGDQGRDVVIVRDFLKNGNLFFIGPQTSIGNMYLGPFYYYLIAPALLLANFNPVGPAIFVALLGVATAYLIFFVTKKWFNSKAAFIAAFLYAISPIAIKYSNFSWNPNIMPFFALLFVYLMTEKRYLWASLAFAMCLNSHYLALLLLPVAFIIWLKNSPQKYLKETILAILIFLLSLIPQILFDLRHQGQNIKALATFFTQRETTVNLKAYKSLPVIPRLFNQINTDLLAGKNIYFGVAISIILFIGIIYLLLKHRNQNLIYCVLWYLTGLIGLGLYKQHIYSHYFGFLIPSIFIIIGYILSILYKQKIIGKVLSILILISLSYLCIKSSPILKPANSQLNHAYNLAKSISEHYQDSDGSYNIALLASYNDYRGLAPRYFIENNFPSKNFLNQEKYQEIDTLYVIIDDPSRWSKGINTDIWEISVSGHKKVVEEFSSIDNTKIYKLKKIKDIKL